MLSFVAEYVKLISPGNFSSLIQLGLLYILDYHMENEATKRKHLLVAP